MNFFPTPIMRSRNTFAGGLKYRETLLLQRSCVIEWEEDSVAIGFSLRDILSNCFSGIILLASRPFRLGDQIIIRDFEGTVAQIQLRATTIETYDGRIVYIPNQEVFSAIITNNTACTIRRSSVTRSALVMMGTLRLLNAFLKKPFWKWQGLKPNQNQRFGIAE
ncbi:small-conductance mechanosensitive channel [Pleurocapsa sp. PCC 7327]|nr:mechanosensitive ion channel domain-containing protein [Pleurocapsa sp. PCC 7327]AFY75625.1 small-conductance mechanosensitive channel [Pleurocapsa sp. PCC 7327]